MKLVESFYDLFDYNKKCNELYIEFFTQKKITVDKPLKVMSHILNSHEIWLARVAGSDSRLEVWQLHEISLMRELNNLSFSKTRNVLNELNDETIEKEITYSNSKGDVFKNSIRQILHHVINHSAYHRGQLAIISRQLDMDPPKTDYIALRR